MGGSREGMGVRKERGDREGGEGVMENGGDGEGDREQTDIEGREKGWKVSSFESITTTALARRQSLFYQVCFPTPDTYII